MKAAMESRADLRKELEDAIADVRRQISVQTVRVDVLPGGPGPTGSALAIRALEDELARLEEALADLSDEA
jgi:hypothetical protein